MNEYLNDKFDSQFSESLALTWLPFVGKYYDSKEEKFLIVGESHYVPDNEDADSYLSKDWTRQFILKDGLQIKPWFTDGAKNNLVREIEKTLSGKIDNSCWESFSFYNLIQRLMTGRDKRPSYQDILDGLEAFVNVVSILKPTKVIFCGVEAGKHFVQVLNKLGIDAKAINIQSDKLNGTIPKKFEVTINNQLITCLFIKHPSMAFSSNLWRRHVLEM